MASTALARYSSPTASRPSAARAIVVRMPTPPKAKKTHRRRLSVGHNSQTEMVGAAIGGAVLGYLDKQQTVIPTLPVIGRAGTLALAAYIFRDKSPWIRSAATAFAAIAAYELTREGAIAGVHGIAAEM
jgi:hypothetical protein